jgi:hypothetical protein
MISTRISYDLQRRKRRLPQGETLDYLHIHGMSTRNEYIPYNVGWCSVAVYNRQLIHYSIPAGVNDVKPFKQYSHLYNALESATFPSIFQTSSMSSPIYVMKGLLYSLVNDTPVIHFMIGVKSDYIFNIDFENLDYSKFVLFLSYDFTNGRVFDNIYKKLYKDKLINLQNIGIDTIVTKDINKWCFKSTLPELKFDTIDQREEYLKQFNETIF